VEEIRDAVDEMKAAGDERIGNRPVPRRLPQRIEIAGREPFRRLD
jgi:hypothetical protein